MTFDDDRLVDHAGLLLAAELGQALGLAGLLDERVSVASSEGAHPADKALTVVHGLLAGADCIDDVDLLRSGSSAAVLGHRVAAPSTVGSFLRALTVGHVRQLDAVAAQLLRRAWALEGPLLARRVIDLDSTRCETYGLRKEGARLVMHGGGRGFHPILAVAATGEVVHARLRRGRTNDGSGAARFVGETLARAARAGATELVVRADSGFYQADVVDACRRRGANFSIGARIQRGLAEAIADIPEDRWVPISYPYGEGAAVAEIPWRSFTVTHHSQRVQGVDARMIVRRVPPSPGLQAPLFPVFGYHPFITDLPGDIVTLDAFHREHACVENVIKDLKHNGGLNHLPSGRFGANSAWLVLATIAHNLARWVGRLGFGDGTRTLKTLRRRALSVPGRITRSGRRRQLHLPARWPWATHFAVALERLRRLPGVT